MQLMLSNAWYPAGNRDVPCGFQSSQEDIHGSSWLGRQLAGGTTLLRGAWSWVLNCKMRQQPISGASQFGGLSTHRRSQEEGEGGPPTLKDGTDEAAAGVRLSPSAEGGKTVLTGPSRSWPNRGSFNGGRNRAGFTQQHGVSQSKHLAV